MPVNVRELEAIYNSWPPEVRNKAECYFYEIDNDRSGYISMNELWQFMSKRQGRAIPDHEFQYWWQQFDADGSGSLSFMECLGFYWCFEHARFAPSCAGCAKLMLFDPTVYCNVNSCNHYALQARHGKAPDPREWHSLCTSCFHNQPPFSVAFRGCNKSDFMQVHNEVQKPHCQWRFVNMGSDVHAKARSHGKDQDDDSMEEAVGTIVVAGIKKLCDVVANECTIM